MWLLSFRLIEQLDPVSNQSTKYHKQKYMTLLQQKWNVWKLKSPTTFSMINTAVATRVPASIPNSRICYSLQYIQETTSLLHTPLVWKVSKDRTEMKVKGKQQRKQKVRETVIVCCSKMLWLLKRYLKVGGVRKHISSPLHHTPIYRLEPAITAFTSAYTHNTDVCVSMNVLFCARLLKSKLYFMHNSK